MATAITYHDHSAAPPSLRQDLMDLIVPVIDRHAAAWLTAGTSDLYELLKALSQELVYALFLGMASNEANHADYARMQGLSETVSRGQFSAPVNFRLGFIGSAYSRGLQAKREYDKQVQRRVVDGHCPFFGNASPSGGIESVNLPGLESRCTHASMFTSALVIKSLASYLTHFFLQLYRLGQEGSSLAARLPCESSPELYSAMMETERLCPPIIGVLRHVKDKSYRDPAQRFAIPAGWDCWLYFPLINRDKSVYGPDAEYFQEARFMRSSAGTSSPC